MKSIARHKKALLASVALSFLLAGCASLASVLGGIATWAPFATTVVQGFSPILSVSNAQLGAEATNIGTLIGDVGTAASAAESAGANQAGAQKVIAEIQAIEPSIAQFESGLTATGVNVSKNDQTYIADATGIVLVALEGYQAVLEQQAGTITATSTAELHPIRGSCFGIEPEHGGPYHVWADCDANSAMDYTVNPITGSVTMAKGKKPASIANWKRQFNAIARKYGHANKQLNLSTRDHIIHVLTLGMR